MYLQSDMKSIQLDHELAVLKKACLKFMEWLG